MIRLRRTDRSEIDIAARGMQEILARDGDLRRMNDTGGSEATTSSRERLERALAQAQDPSGEGGATFTVLLDESARTEADASDERTRSDRRRSPVDGLAISVKDLFDVAGVTTLAGSVVLAADPPAGADATIVARLRAAGAVIAGKTNMTEFAYSGLGLNPHHGTPRNPWDRTTGRIPGGSSSGAATSVAYGMADAAIGTDTGGSVRIPAGLCGLVGFKPTARRVPLEGTYPLSFTLDSIGPLAPTVGLCASLDAILAGEREPSPEVPPLRGLRFRSVTNYVDADWDEHVATAYEGALRTLRDAGATVEEGPLSALERLRTLSAGTISASEAYWWHRDRLASEGERYDQRVRTRIMTGSTITAADYIAALQQRAAFAVAFAREASEYDALLWPTLPVVAPAIAPLERDDALYTRTNLLMLRNTTIVNLADGCALSLPISVPGAPPVGLSLNAPAGYDARILTIARALEAAFAIAPLSVS